MNENINMRIIRYFVSEYPNIKKFIHKDFANEIKKLKLQDFAFSNDKNQQDIINRIKTFNQEILERLHKQTQSSKDIKTFSKEIFAQIFTLVLKSRILNFNKKYFFKTCFFIFVNFIN